jgi:hypothetical protein
MNVIGCGNQDCLCINQTTSAVYGKAILLFFEIKILIAFKIKILIAKENKITILNGKGILI